MIEIIAEVAQGYEGNPKLSELLALAAVRSDADAVKYQIIFADELAIPEYQYYDLFKSLEMGIEIWQNIVNIVHSQNKKMYFDVFGDLSLELAKSIGADGIKISTTDFYNTPLINRAIENFNKVFISVGGVPIDDIDELVNQLNYKEDQITLMYGFQAEPTPIEENNLLRIPEFKKRYPNLSIGFMDHSDGGNDEAFYLPLMAVSLGVSQIEKHITLDRILEIEDFVSALDPERFKKFVAIVKMMESSLGKAVFDLTAKEQKYKNLAGKVVVAKCAINEGEILKEKNLTMKRVSVDGSHGCFRKVSQVLGKKISKSALKNSPITQDLI
jgi:sialic acid synthase SpsE